MEQKDTISLQDHLRSVIEANDRRYTEVNVEKEKALKIKEEADKVALGLARDIQRYKDEKANELREQINRERGLYATKDDVISAIKEVNATIRPLIDFMNKRSGESGGIKSGWAWAAAVLGTIVAVWGLLN